jgi:hypothetical protein
VRFIAGVAFGVLFGWAALAFAENMSITPFPAASCGGDLTGTYPNCIVNKINGATPAAVATSGSASDLSAGTVGSARMPALTGDCVTSVGAVATTCTPKRPVTTVGSLPSCTSGIKGQMQMVTDALVPVAIATVAAGGAVSIGVTCNGTNWIVQ